jgi:guanylate kinase
LKEDNCIAPGVALVVSGPSGAGKSTLCSGVREKLDLHFSVSCTTRAPRKGEVDGTHYYFISKSDFEAKISNGEFIEYADVFGNYYGTLKSEVLEQVRRGRDVFLDIDIQGAMQIKACAENDPLLAECCEFVFIAPPSLEELERRLRGRNTDAEEVIKMRLAKSSYELSFWKKYDYLVINDDIDRAVSEMQAILIAVHAESRRKKGIWFDDN